MVGCLALSQRPTCPGAGRAAACESGHRWGRSGGSAHGEILSHHHHPGLQEGIRMRIFQASFGWGRDMKKERGKQKICMTMRGNLKGKPHSVRSTVLTEYIKGGTVIL